MQLNLTPSLTSAGEARVSKNLYFLPFYLLIYGFYGLFIHEMVHSMSKKHKYNFDMMESID